MIANAWGSPGVRGNPSSVHAHGRAARRVLEDARESLAASLGAHPTEVVFTSGGTEGDNLALAGLWSARCAQDPAKRRIVVGATEHHAVLDRATDLVTRQGALVTWLEPDRTGRVSAAAVAEVLSAQDDVGVVSLMWANNEVGTLAPVAEIATVCRVAGVPFHTDAVAAVGHVPVDFAASGATALTLSGHKFGAPVAVGALLVRRDATVTPGQFGGGQERGIRPGTVDVIGALALAEAARVAVADLDHEARRIAALRDHLVRGATRTPGVRASIPSGIETLPGHAHLLVAAADSEALVFLFDTEGISVSAGSACTAGVTRTSHVLLAMGIPEVEAAGALRVTLGHTTTADDVERFLEALPQVVERARDARTAGDVGDRS